MPEIWRNFTQKFRGESDATMVSMPILPARNVPAPSAAPTTAMAIGIIDLKRVFIADFGRAIDDCRRCGQCRLPERAIRMREDRTAAADQGR
jgi:hypothetical protein